MSADANFKSLGARDALARKELTFVRCGRNSSSGRLRSEDIRQKEVQDQAALGGMRKPTSAVAQIPRLQHAGRILHDVLTRTLRESPTQAIHVLSALDDDGDGPDE
eukprot:4471698-Amphidinium_carterae.1